MRLRSRRRLFGIGAGVGLCFVLCIVWFAWQSDRMTLGKLNDHLDAGGIQLGMPEAEVVMMWGEGEYIYGWGGHGRNYADKKIRVGFSDDPVNDLYEKVSDLIFTSVDYSIFGIKVGDDRHASRELLLAAGFKQDDYSDDLLVNGEYGISLKGNPRIMKIQITFIDKDLKDRNY